LYKELKSWISGIDKKTKTENPDLLIDEFAYSLSQTVKRISNPGKGEKKYDGIVFLLDEADNASTKLKIGYFFKTLSEMLIENGCPNVMFILAGLDEVVSKLRDSHPSLLRNFDILDIKGLKKEDRKLVISKGLEKGNEINEEKTTITDEATTLISTLSEGYPHLIQQFAYSAFEFNEDSEIDTGDVLDSTMNDGGAVDEIGKRYYRNDFYDRIKSDEYRQVLSIIAENMNSWIKKKEI